MPEPGNFWMVYRSKDSSYTNGWSLRHMIYNYGTHMQAGSHVSFDFSRESGWNMFHQDVTWIYDPLRAMLSGINPMRAMLSMIIDHDV